MHLWNPRTQRKRGVTTDEDENRGRPTKDGTPRVLRKRNIGTAEGSRVHIQMRANMEHNGRVVRRTEQKINYIH